MVILQQISQFKLKWDNGKEFICVVFCSVISKAFDIVWHKEPVGRIRPFSVTAGFVRRGDLRWLYLKGAMSTVTQKP